jgi:CubicO group peptidase (beta-lactamase class C family)
MKIKPDKQSTSKRLLLLTLTCILLLPGFLKAQVAKKPVKALTYKIIDSIIQHYVNQGSFGGVVTIAEKNITTYNKAYGMANMELSVKNDTIIRFQIGSMSKQFCAALILMAESEGKIALDSPLQKYLPYTKKAASGTLGAVTIHQLLAMRSGIPS